MRDATSKGLKRNTEYRTDCDAVHGVTARVTDEQMRDSPKRYHFSSVMIVSISVRPQPSSLGGLCDEGMKF